MGLFDDIGDFVSDVADVAVDVVDDVGDAVGAVVDTVAAPVVAIGGGIGDVLDTVDPGVTDLIGTPPVRSPPVWAATSRAASSGATPAI